jgi:DNA invertase Pin-like site-specific DNA recombinase
LLLNLVGSVAQFEREVMLERQREGVAKAKEEGKYKGRAMTARAKSDDVLRLYKAGKGASEIAVQLGIGRASVYRIVNDAKSSVAQ